MPKKYENKRDLTSALSNGSKSFLSDVDGRSPLARRYKDLVWEFSSQVGGNPTPAQLQLVRRAAGLSIQCELLECDMVSGNTVNLMVYPKLVTCLGQVLGKLGIARMSVDTHKMKTIDHHSLALTDGDDDDD